MNKEELRRIAVTSVEIVEGDPTGMKIVHPINTLLSICRTGHGRWIIKGLSREKIIELIYQELLEWDEKTQNIDWDDLYNRQLDQ